MKLLVCMSLLVCVSVLYGADAVTYVEGKKKVPGGYISKMKHSTEADFTLEWSVPKFGPKPDTTGKKYVEVFAQVEPGKSMGKHDFTLTGNDCIAMATGTSAYDPMTREYINEGKTPAEVKLLFLIKESDTLPYPMSFQYTAELPTFDPSVVSVTLDMEGDPDALGGGGDVMMDVKETPAAENGDAAEPAATPTKTPEKKTRKPVTEGW